MNIGVICLVPAGTHSFLFRAIFGKTLRPNKLPVHWLDELFPPWVSAGTLKLTNHHRVETINACS